MTSKVIVTRVRELKGRVLMTRQDAARELNVSPQTIDNRCKGIKKEILAGRYPEASVIEDGGIKLVNYLVLIDYMTYKSRLNDTNLRKHVPLFDAHEIAKGLGFYAEEEEL